ncbi:MAG: hypothetical protein ACE5F9_02730 [Phycisphaerae bacterium]
MATEADKIMFEIYREADYDRRYRVVFFTELDDRNKEREIGLAMAGEHFFDGFLKEVRKAEGKKKVRDLVDRLNADETLSPEQVARELATLEVVAD